MERLNRESTPDKKGLKIDMVRHGPATYRQCDWNDVKTADDLNTVGRYIDEQKTIEAIAK